MSIEISEIEKMALMINRFDHENMIQFNIINADYSGYASGLYPIGKLPKKGIDKEHVLLCATKANLWAKTPDRETTFSWINVYLKNLESNLLGGIIPPPDMPPPTPSDD